MGWKFIVDDKNSFWWYSGKSLQTENTRVWTTQDCTFAPDGMTWKTRFKTQVSSGSDFPSDAMLWIKEVEMADSLDELKSLRSVCGKDFPNFETFDAKIASALNKIIQNSHFKKKVSLEEQRAQKEDRFLWGRQIAFMIYDYFRVIGAHDTVLDSADLFSITVRNDNVQEFHRRWDEILLSLTKIPSDDILESLYELKISESAQLKTVLELYDMEIHQKMSVPNYQKLKTMVKRSIDLKLRLRNFDARHGRIESGAVVKNRKGSSGVEGGKCICYLWKERGQCSKGDRCGFRHETQDRATKTRTHCRHAFWANRITGSKCVEEKKYSMQK